MLEIDKLGTGIQGDRSGTLLEVLDPRQYATRAPSDGRLTEALGLEAIPQLEAIITALRSAAGVKVVVIDSAVGKIFPTHSNFPAKLENRQLCLPVRRTSSLCRPGAC